MPSYDVNIHQNARDSLQELPKDDYQRVTNEVLKVSKRREPTSHNDVKPLDGADLLRLRVGDFRVILEFRKPNLNVLVVGKRKTVYDSLDVAKQRAQG